jgi:hypothetical protein
MQRCRREAVGAVLGAGAGRARKEETLTGVETGAGSPPGLPAWVVTFGDGTRRTLDAGSALGAMERAEREARRVCRMTSHHKRRGCPHCTPARCEKKGDVRQ